MQTSYYTGNLSKNSIQEYFNLRLAASINLEPLGMGIPDTRYQLYTDGKALE